MSLSISHPEPGGILITAEGVVTAAEIRAYNEDLYATPEDIRAIRYQIVDFRGVTHIEAPSSDIRLLAEQDSRAAEINPGMLIAVVGETDIIFGLSRMWDAYLQGAPFESGVFRTMEAAEEWIHERL